MNDHHSPARICSECALMQRDAFREGRLQERNATEATIRSALAFDAHRLSKTAALDLSCSCGGFWGGPDGEEIARAWREHLIEAAILGVAPNPATVCQWGTHCDHAARQSRIEPWGTLRWLCDSHAAEWDSWHLAMTEFRK